MNPLIKSYEITSAQSENISGTGKNGKPFSFNKQTIYAHVEGETYPLKSEFILEDGQAPLSIGTYDLHPSSVYIDRNGRVAINPLFIPSKK
jgi:hypothetical protein